MKKTNLFVLLTSFLLIGCTPANNNSEPASPVSVLPSREIDQRFELADLGDDVTFHTEFQQSYLDEEDVEAVPADAKGLKEYSLPNPVTLTWEDEADIEDYVVTISEKDDFSAAKTYEVSGEKSLDIYNLKIGTKYYWTVSEKGSDIMSATATFTIRDQGPRNVKVDGMTNCRDIGGYMTSSGGRVRQDLIWRTGNSDNINEQGKKTLAEFGFKTEIDLRDSGYKSASPAGADIEYLVYKMYYNDYHNYLERNCESVKSTLKVFADEENYPIFYHCRIGTDRTGFVTYLLLGLMGVDVQDIYRDYLFSNFGVIEDARSLHGSGVNNVQLYYAAIDDFPGVTLQQRIYNFLCGIGMTHEELDNIIRINVEGGENVKVLDGCRACYISAEKLVANGVSKETYNNTNSQSTIDFYALNKNIDASVTASFNLSAEADVDVYCYMYASTASLNINACDAFELKLDNADLEVTDRTFSDLHLRNSAGVYVAGRISEGHFSAGNHTLVLTNIAGGTNTTGLGANVAAIVLIPRTNTVIEAA